MYERIEYRQPEIHAELSRRHREILSAQNPDGGFPYERNVCQSHMGIPATMAGQNVSTMFPTWFRVHTLGLIDHVLNPAPAIRFNNALSMGWHDHAMPPPSLGPFDRARDMPYLIRARLRGSRFLRRVHGRLQRWRAR